jgi:hypothetical protein
MMAKRRQQAAEKRFGMLRVPQHDRNIFSEAVRIPFILSLLEGLREFFQQSAS